VSQPPSAQTPEFHRLLSRRVHQANDNIKNTPINERTADMITPFFDVTGRTPPNDSGAMSGAMMSTMELIQHNLLHHRC
jgi:hypothetical protein